MPRAPKHCGIQGCTVLVPNGQRCRDHQHGWGKGNPRTKNPKHIAWRLTVLDRCGWRCQLRYPGCIDDATIADHIIATKLGGAEYDPSNGQGACRPCHDRKSSTEGHQAQGHAAR